MANKLSSSYDLRAGLTHATSGHESNPRQPGVRILLGVRIPRRAFSAVIVLVSALVLLNGCDGGPDEAVEATESATQTPEVTLVLLGGEVQLARADRHPPDREAHDFDTHDDDAAQQGFERAELGMLLEPGDFLRTGENARAVIRFGDQAVVWLQEDSELEISEPFEHRERQYYGVQLRHGAAAGLSAADEHRRLRLRAPQLSAIATGTSFLVSAEAESATVAVTDGSVAVFPSSVDLHRVALRVRDPELSEAVERLLARSVELGSDDQLKIESEALRESDAVLEDAIRDIDRFEEGALEQEERTRTVTLLDYAGDRISRRMPAVERIYAGSKSVLDQLASATPVRFDPGARPAGLSEIRIETDPDDAEILLEDQPIGRRVFTSLFDEDETVQLRVRRDGYRERSVELAPPHEQTEVITVRLEPIEPAYSEDEFLQAVRDREHRIVRRYLDTGGEVNAVSPQGYHALALALGLPEIGLDNLETFDPDLELIEMLLEGGVAVNLEFYRLGQQLSALHVPILAGLASGELDLELIRMLLEYGANPDFVLETGTMRVTPLAITLIVGIENRSVNHELLQILLEHGANPNTSVTYEGRVLSPIMIALVLGDEYDYADPDAVELLAEHDADLNGLVNVNGMIGSPLYFAEYFEQHELTETLRRYGAQL